MAVHHPLWGFQLHVASLLAYAAKTPVRAEDIVLSLPKVQGMADITVTAALRFAPKGQALAVAQTVAKGLVKSMDCTVESVTVDGPGYLNIRLSKTAMAAIARWAHDAGPNVYGRGSNTGTPILLEFVSANPTGPLHVGHTRGAAVGDSLARLLRFSGRSVTTEYYLNDAGSQVETLGRSVLARWEQALGRDVALPTPAYPGAYLVPVGKELAVLQGAPGDDGLDVATTFGLERMISGIQGDLGDVSVAFDRFVSEQKARDAYLVDALQTIGEAGLLFEAVPPAAAEGGGGEGLCLMMQTTLFGDDQDRVVRKADGSFTYFAGDLAHFAQSIAEGHTRFVVVLGADHAGYKARLQGAVQALSGGRATLDVVFVGLVSLMEDGAPVTMSKRAGRFETLHDLVADLGSDSVRCSMVSRSAQTPMAFDLNVARSTAKDNPAFYLQYACARLASVARSQPNGRAKPMAFHDADRALMARVALWPFVVQRAAEQMDPHTVYQAAMDLASHVHALWSQAKTDPKLRLADTPERAGIAAAALSALSASVQLLGLVPAERMERTTD